MSVRVIFASLLQKLYREPYKLLNLIMYKVIYLYILKCNDGSLYIGVTNNLDKRVLEHNSGIKTDCYTYDKRPVELVYHTYFTDYNLAFEWETKIKKWSRAKKQALINGDSDLLKLLSKKKFTK
jgi:putative endonuclease